MKIRPKYSYSLNAILYVMFVISLIFAESIIPKSQLALLVVFGVIFLSVGFIKGFKYGYIGYSVTFLLIKATQSNVFLHASDLIKLR